MKSSIFKKFGIGALTLGLLATSTNAYAETSDEVQKTPIKSTVITIGEDSGFTTMGAGTWDLINGGSTDWSFKKGEKGSLGRVHSSGGDFRITFLGGHGEFTFDLMEYDPSGSTTVKKGIKVKSDNTFTFRDISKYVDGDNKKAEFYIKYYNTKTSGFYRIFYYD
ncbi:hypothetical protein C2I17_21225 [Niallia circulans]|uniref:hypothetical protein n=1 Tax=Niallia circulans TaxID=1397 RepID=UPI00201D685D|nr:hypothetical protein [Niallia circulans]UQZ76862.1 hypothetical protein C2I17_21225 [Niallia circulans]